MPNITPFQAGKLRAFHAVQAAVRDLPAMDVVDVLTQQLRVIAGDMQHKAIPDLPVLRLRPHERLMDIEKDPELEAFILTQSASYTIEHIRMQCVREFGEKRAPSKSALHRYIQRLIRRNKETNQ